MILGDKKHSTFNAQHPEKNQISIKSRPASIRLHQEATTGQALAPPAFATLRRGKPKLKGEDEQEDEDDLDCSAGGRLGIRLR